jgi:hypothetical protein
VCSWIVEVLFYNAVGTFRTTLTLEVDEPQGRAVGPRRVTQQYSIEILWAMHIAEADL